MGAPPPPFIFSDAGKSTIGGQIQKLTGMVDQRTLEKYQREAKEKNREFWYLSWCMDTNEEGKWEDIMLEDKMWTVLF